MVDPAELRAIPFLEDLAANDLIGLADSADPVDVSAGVEVTREGEFGHSVFAIVDGTAEVAVDGAVVRHLTPGDVFGEIAVLASGRRTATVTSTSQMRLISLFKRDLWRLGERNPEFAEALRDVTAVTTDA